MLENKHTHPTIHTHGNWGPQTRAQCYKNIYAHNLRIFAIGLNVCPSKVLWPGLMFAGEAEAYPIVE
jgi:hypothetical protein